MNQTALLQSHTVHRRPDGLLAFVAPDVINAQITADFYDGVKRLGTNDTEMLIDARAMKHVGPDARRLIYQRSGEVAHIRGAVLTATRLQRVIVQFLAMATGHVRKVRCFKDESDAIRWLRG